MCLMVYVGVEEPLRLMPWRKEQTTLCVDNLHPSSRSVFSHFTTPLVYYLASCEGCGCGFIDAEWTAADEALFHDESIPLDVRQGWREFYLRRRQSVLDLSSYLSRLLDTGRVELHACWAGDEARGAERPVRISPLDVAAGRFRLDAVKPGYPVHATVVADRP